MDQPAFDLKKPECVLKEVFDPDEAVKTEFQNKFSFEIVAFSQAFSPAYAKFEELLSILNDAVQPTLICAFMHGVLDDLLISMKLILTGKLSASGNLIRQCIEGLFMAIMCSQMGTLSIGKKEQVYWKLVEADDHSVEGHIAGKQIVCNQERLELNDSGLLQLKTTLKFYDAHSHAGRLSIANRTPLVAKELYFGGHFDSEKVDGYLAELQQRILLCKIAEDTCDYLLPRVRRIIESGS